MGFEGNAKKTIEGMTKCFLTLGETDIESIYQNRIETRQVAELDTACGKVLAVEKENRYYFLNSCYDAQKASEDWTKQFLKDEINENSILMVFGLSDGKSLLELTKKKPNSWIFVYEPCLDIFWKAMNYSEVAEIANMEKVCLIVKGMNEELLFHALQAVMDYSNYQLTVQAIQPNYLQLFHTEYQNMLEIYKNVAKTIIYTRNTLILRGVEMQHNSYGLMKDMMEECSIVQLKDIIKKKKMEDMPAILVAAGPSLDKNVAELKKAKGKAFLMVVDTALNTVLENEIIPDMTICMDSRKPLVLFKNPKFVQIPIVLSLNSNQDVVHLNKAKHFYEVDELSYVAKLVAGVDKKTMQLPTGGSVANNAMSLLFEMGFETIILVGQDLAYPGGVEHAEAAYGKGKDNVDKTKKQYIEVEDNYGNMVLTETNMNMYREWIENFVAAYKNLKVINATEGGAKIAGTEFIRLSEAIERYCTKEYNIPKLLTAEAYFSEEERNQLMQKVKNVPEMTDDLEEKIKQGKKLYAEVENLNRKGKNGSQQMQRMMQEISCLNQELEENVVAAMLQVYVAKTDYEIQGEVLKYKESDSAIKLVNDFVAQGNKMMNAYLEAIKKLREDMPMILKDF